jgi:hypothetical protein
MRERIWWHWQNLNDDGRDLLHGRAWLHHGERTVQVSWRVGRWNGLRAMLTRGGEEEDYTLGLGFGWGNLWLILSGFRPYNALPRGWGRDTGFYLHEDHLVVSWNCNDSSWSSETGPAHGWQKSWFLKDVFLGHAKYVEGEGEPVPAVISMPEADYPCTVTIRTDEWRRPRWRTLRLTRADVDIPGGVPIPGKGENAWDCDEDAIFGQTAPATSVAEAVESVRQSAERRRLKYGGCDWKPTRKSA